MSVCSDFTHRRTRSEKHLPTVSSASNRKFSIWDGILLSSWINRLYDKEMLKLTLHCYIDTKTTMRWGCCMRLAWVVVVTQVQSWHVQKSFVKICKVCCIYQTALRMVLTHIDSLPSSDPMSWWNIGCTIRFINYFKNRDFMFFRFVSRAINPKGLFSSVKIPKIFLMFLLCTYLELLSKISDTILTKTRAS